MARRRDLGRINADELVIRTPPMIALPNGWVLGIATIAVLGLAGITFHVLWSWWRPSVAVVFLAAPLLVLFAWDLVGRTIIDWVRSGQIANSSGQILANNTYVGSECDVSGLQSGTWVCLKADHLDRQRALRGRSNGPLPSVPYVYRLVVAVHPKGTQQKTFGFSDGTSVDWFSTKRAIQMGQQFLPKPFKPRSGGEQLDVAAVILGEIVGSLHENRQGVSLKWLLKDHPDGEEQPFWHAVRCLLLWGLAKPLEEIELQEFYKRDRQSLSDVVLCLTRAGVVWHDSTDEVQKDIEEARRRARMDPNRRSPINISGGNFHGIQNFASDVSAEQTVNIGASVNGQEVLEALRDLLQRSDIPWSSPQLEGARGVVDDVVERQDPTDPRLKRAVRLILQVCASLGVGIAGSGAYEILRSFAA